MSSRDMSFDDLSPSKPLSEAVLLILVSLAGGTAHGYALIKDIDRLSDGRVRLSTGTLYGALRRLLDAGWIDAFDQHDRSRDKQAYRLTSEGRRRLRIEVARLQHVTGVASARLHEGEA
jgi:DNA-binding PadR family transcriptional regulator